MLNSKHTHDPLATRGWGLAPTDRLDLDQLILPVGGRVLMDCLEDTLAAILFLDPTGQLDPTADQVVSPEDVISRSSACLALLAPAVDRILAENGFAFWFPPPCPFATTAALENAVSSCFGFHRMIWVKSCSAHAPARRRVRMCHEVFYLIWPSGRDQPIPIRSLPDVLRVTPEDHGNAYPHRSIKPVALFERLIKACTLPGGYVVVPFAGTGTAIEAALRLGHKVIGAELDPDARAKANERLARLRMDFSDDPITAAFVTERGIATL